MDEFVYQIHEHLPGHLRSQGLIAPQYVLLGPFSPLVGQLSLFAAVNMQPPLALILELLLLIFSHLGN